MTALVIYETIDMSGTVRFLYWVDEGFNNLSTWLASVWSFTADLGTTGTNDLILLPLMGSWGLRWNVHIIVQGWWMVTTLTNRTPKAVTVFFYECSPLFYWTCTNWRLLFRVSFMLSCKGHPVVVRALLFCRDEFRSCVLNTVTGVLFLRLGCLLWYTFCCSPLLESRDTSNCRLGSFLVFVIFSKNSTNTGIVGYGSLVLRLKFVASVVHFSWMLWGSLAIIGFTRGGIELGQQCWVCWILFQCFNLWHRRENLAARRYEKFWTYLLDWWSLCVLWTLVLQFESFSLASHPKFVMLA